MWSRAMVMLAVLVVSAGCVKKVGDGKSAQAPADALQFAKDKVKATPSYENYIGLGLELAKRGMSEDALAAYKKASEINPKAPLAWNNICAELNGKMRFNEAIPNCEKALALEPNFQLAKNNLAHSKKMLEEGKKASRKKKESLLASGSAKSSDFLSLGMEFYNLGEMSEATDLWARIKKGDPNYATAKNNRASAFIIMNQFSSAERELGEALALEPKNQLFLNNKAWLEQKKAAVK